MYRLITGVCFLSVSIAACSSGEQKRSQPSDVGSSLDALSWHEACATLNSDDSIVGDGVTAPSPRTYTHSQCSKAWIVEVLTGSDTEQAVARWVDTKPTTQQDCQNAEVISYYWEAQYDAGFNVTWVPLIARSSWGSWGPFNDCSPPAVMAVGEAMDSDALYKFALSARQIAADGSYTTRSVHLEVSPAE